MVRLSPAEFEGIVSEALDSLPTELLELLDNIVVLVEDEPPGGEDDDLLGLYDGIPLTERAGAWGFLPDRIRIFRGPHLRAFPDAAELREEVAVTVVHELAHHFGIDDDRLHDLGWE